MSPPPKPPPVALASYRGLPHRLMAVCESCLHTARLDLETLIARLGADATTDDVRRRLRCRRCNGRNAGLLVNGSPCGAMARHLSPRPPGGR